MYKQTPSFHHFKDSECHQQHLKPMAKIPYFAVTHLLYVPINDVKNSLTYNVFHSVTIKLHETAALLEHGILSNENYVLEAIIHFPGVIFCCYDKHHYQKQSVEERDCFILYF